MKIRGNVEAPELNADVTARNLRWQELSVAQVRLLGDVKSTDQIGGSLDLRVERLAQGDINLRLITLAAKGNEKSHQMALRVQGEPVSGQLDLRGSFDRQAMRWRRRD